MCGFLVSATYFPVPSVPQNYYDRHLLAHRGPDSYDHINFNDSHLDLNLYHSRLSIIDLSFSANQPMSSICGRYTLVYNGEILNYIELRSYLYKHYLCTFRSSSDTEVLLQGLIHMGPSFLSLLDGMFSFVLLDRKSYNLLIARDPFGIKPLYYTHDSSSFALCSEIPTILDLPFVQRSCNLSTIYSYLVYGQTDFSNQTFFSDILSFPAACYSYIDLESNNFSTPISYWHPPDCNTEITFEDAQLRFFQILEDTLVKYTRSDVPVGVTLSGGLDSSTLLILLSRLNAKSDSIAAFSYLAGDKYSFDERQNIFSLLNSLSVEGYQCSFNHQELLRDIHRFINLQAEPCGSPSVYAQFLVYQLARSKGYSVVLDGQGADEILAGYLGYPGSRIHSLIDQNKFLSLLHYSVGWASLDPSRHLILPFLYFLKKVLPAPLLIFARLLQGRNSRPSWIDLSHFANKSPPSEFRPPSSSLYKADRIRESLISAITKYGLPGLLRVADRNSMASSVEARYPFLSLPLVNFCLSLPEHFLIGPTGASKYLLRSSLSQILPLKFVHSHIKIGFETPCQEFDSFFISSIKQELNHTRYPLLNDSKLLKYLNRSSFRRESTLIWRIYNYIMWYNAFFGSDYEN